MATAGKILMFPVGNWTSGNNYGFLDIVYYGGSSYIAKTDIANSTTNPVTDTTNWQILAHGYIADTLSGIDGIDTSGLLGTVGATVTGQALLDEIADRVATKLVLKTAISNQQVNDTTKVTGSALAYSMGESIDTLNSNLTYKNYETKFERNSTPGDKVLFTKYGNVKRFSMWALNEWASPADAEVKLCDIPAECIPDNAFYKYMQFATGQIAYISIHNNALYMTPSTSLVAGKEITLQDVYF